MITDEIRQLAKKIWTYNFIQEPLKKSDAILVLGNDDLRIAEHAAKLFKEAWAPLVIFSGGLSSFTSKIFDTSEADAFAEVAAKNGVPWKRIILEKDSQNTGQNLEFTKTLLLEQGRQFQSLILLQKPNMLRRVKASALQQWPEIQVIVSSHAISFEEAPHAHLTEEMLVHEVVGDLERVRIYPKRGFQIPQVIPEDVWAAYEELVFRGFTGHLTE